MNTRSTQPRSIAGRFIQKIGATNASPSAAATFSCWASTSFGFCFATNCEQLGEILVA